MKIMIPLLAALAAVALLTARNRRPSDDHDALIREQLNKPRRSYAQ